MPSSRAALRRVSSRLLALATVAAAFPASSKADITFNWLGGNYDNWSANNWEGYIPATLGTGVTFNFGSAGTRLLPLDSNGRIYMDLSGGNEAFKVLNFSRQEWTMSGRDLHTNDSTINVYAASPGVTIENNLIIHAYSTSTSFSNFDLNVASQLTMTGVISQYDPTIGSDTTGSLRKYGAGTLTLTNRNTYTGGTNVFAGRLIDHYAHGNYNNGSALEFHTKENQSFGGSIFGAGSFTKSGTAALTLTGPITYTGITTVNEGRLILGSLLESTSSYTLNRGGELEFNFAGNRTLNKRIDGGGTLVKDGTGVFIVNDLANHQGGTVVNGGRLIDLNPHGSYVTNSVLELRNETVRYISGQGGISGTGALVKSGAGDLWVSDNTYTGGTYVTAGRLIDFNPHGAYETYAALEFRTADTTSYSGAVSGPGSLTKSASGTLTLTGVHSHEGGTTVEEGLLIDQNPSGNYVTNDTLEFANATDRFFSNTAGASAISGTGNFVKSGAGNLAMYRSNSYAGTTTITGGAIFAAVNDVLPTGTDLTIGSGAGFALSASLRQTVASLSGAGSVLLGSNSAFTVNGAASTEFSGVVSGSGSFTKTGDGTLNLSGRNTYSGGTTVSGGLLIDANPHGRYTNNATLEFRTTGDQTYGDVVDGTGSLVKSGAGTMILSGANVYTGGTTVGSGRLVDQNPHGDYTDNAALEFRTATDRNYAGVVSGTGSLTKSGAGTLTLSNSNTHAGGTFIEAGALRMDQNNALPTTGKVDVAAGASLDVNGNFQSLEALTGRGNVFLRDSGRLRVTGDGSTFAGRITSPGSLTKAGSGTFTLSGVNDYSGGTRVQDAGTLRVTGAISGGLTVAPNATFDNASGGLVLGSATLQGTVRTANLTRFTGRVTGAGNFTGGGLVRFDGGYAPGDSPAAIEFAGDLAFGPSNVLTMELGGLALGTGYDHLTVRDDAILGGSLNVVTLSGFTLAAGQSFDLFDFRRTNGTFSAVNLPGLANGLAWDTSALYTSGVIRTTQAVPEPATLAALGLGAVALLKRRRRNG